MLMLLITLFSIIILIPGKYKVPDYQLRQGTKFRLLPTGSRIGYTLIPAKGVKKPYPVIFLQGGPGGPIYDRNIDLLSPLANDGYDIYLYDQIGCGSSARLDKIEDYTIDRHRRDLEEIVKIIGASEVILIGQSWGCILAAQYIGHNADKVYKVIFSSPGPLMPINSDLETIRAPDSLKLITPDYSNRQGKAKIYNIRARAVEFCAKAFNMKLASDKEMDAFSTILNHEMGKSTVCDTSYFSANHRLESGSGYYSMIKTAQRFNEVVDIRQKLVDNNIPALLMRGQCDGIKWGFANEYLQFFKNHRLVIIYGAGHSIGIEQPKVYLQEIRQFLSE